jgi:hypothetical protein
MYRNACVPVFTYTEQELDYGGLQFKPEFWIINMERASCQYSETNVMNFLFSLLRISGLYMFRALFAHPQEALQNRHLVYCVPVS